MAAIFAPILNSTAGLTLTPLQWERTKLSYFALDVVQLLQRPEYAKQIKIPGHLVMDARGLSVNQAGIISFRGTDGAKQNMTVDALFEWIQSFHPVCVAYDKPLPLGLQALPLHLFVSDSLAHQSYHGYFVGQGALHSILDSCYEMDFQLLEKDCQCESCQQGFTRAYLHHLFQHTPMLAQRYLMMHNMYLAAHQPNVIVSLLLAE